ncbi:aspartate kinase [Rubidibacter lacunae KORDI 51-2]|uniref:aspartate kinase n=1 Tax=Rubidibacter lacunae KORDI 51-2 TaxID=582515 RepID=U5DC79_9CHRO|nr:aspartate kinase [Rubidibacter lacunae]ERN42133.1 aspartate kinase [Rubidibacter lacunae KORDI 51-2]
MALIVQKYGGTSVGTVERIRAVAKRVDRTVSNGNAVAVVVSAMGKTTDELNGLARQITSEPSRRELDMLLATGEQVSIALLSMALHELGQPAISLTGAQVGIVTEAEYGRARIQEIRTQRLQRHLREGKVVVIAGFQGISPGDELEITTLGRGGSDTSAVALAAALGADRCEIFTDVPGILTADPRLVPGARLLTTVDCDEILELASVGAKVLHPRAVEIARNFGVELAVRSSWSEEPGTVVLAPPARVRSLTGLELGKVVDAIEYDVSQAKVAMLQVPDSPGIAARLFGEIARQGVDVDLIVQSIHEGNSNDLAFTVRKDTCQSAAAIAEAIAPVLRSHPTAAEEARVVVEPAIAIVSIVGTGTVGRPEIAARMFAALAAVGINLQIISTSEIKISCVLDVPAVGDETPAQRARRACDALQAEFGIEAPPTVPSAVAARNPSVCGVALDRDRAWLAVRHVPDRPGAAARIFEQLASAGIGVDTIIQSQRCRIINGSPARDIAFTAARGNATKATKILQSVSAAWPGSEVLPATEVAKVSIVGAGMLGQPGVAARMFKALATRQINIQAIATSEIKLSCIIGEAEALEAVRAVHATFDLVGDRRNAV